MSLWRQVRRGLRSLVNRSATDSELDAEVRDYFERARTELEREGLSAEAAARATRLALGDAAHVREEVRAYGWENVVESVAGDVRQSARRLRRSPGFTVVGVLTLALGIGASTAIYSAVDPILFASLPYPAAGRIVMLSDIGQDGAPLDVTYGTYRELAARSRSFSALAVADRWRPSLIGAGEPERLTGDRVSAGYFRVLGVRPAMGRDFDAADETIGGPRVAILGAGLARRRFGGGRAVLGRAIRLDGEDYTVVGIMPGDFANVVSPSARIWTPLRYRAHAPFEGPEWGHHLRMVGRLAAGVSLDEARREMLAIGRAPSADFPRPPWASLQKGLVVESLQRGVTRRVRPVLLAILGAVLLLLVIASVNVTNLLLARGAEREGELAVRAALGAGGRRLARQLLTESLLLALIGGLFGLAVARLGVAGLVALAPRDLPRLGAVRLDARAYVFALAVTSLIGIVVGLAPALRGTRGVLRAALHSSARTTGRGRHLLRRGLVVTEVGLALVLLAGAGLLLRSVERLLATPPGFDAGHVLTMQVVAAGHERDADAARLELFRRVLDAVRRVPGVTEAALTSQLPLSGDLDGYGVAFQSSPGASPNDLGSALRYAVTPDWFRTMRIPLVRGRLLDATDRPGAPEAVLLSESFARRVFGERDPIGQRLRIGPEIGEPGRAWDVVVGVVGDVKQASLALEAPNAFYVARWDWVDDVQSLALRTRGDPAALLPRVRRAVWSVDPDLPIVRVSTMEDLLAASEAQRRFALRVFEIFALAALALAGIGLYGIVAGSVAERTREIGVRSALGATRAGILALVLRQGLALTGLGVAVGLLGAAAATRALAALLFGVSTLDPLTYGAVVLLLAAVSVLACWTPAWRAARVDPSVTLRAE